MSRFILWPLIAASWLATGLAQASSRHIEDAALHAIQFVDDKEGWAVGDDGVIWHTIDSGQNWEAQESGVRASLRSLYFHNPYVGWIVGREELPQGGSVGVVLYTCDGGLKWQRLFSNSLPGLNRIRFCDPKTGFVVGDGAEHLPSGLFRTNDGGQSWQPVPGPRSPSWLDGDFDNGEVGALTGAWSRLASLRQGSLATADVDDLGGRSLRGLRLMEGKTLAVGDGGLILSSVTRGQRWGYLQLQLPQEVLAAWNFHAVDSFGDRVWVAGRPGSVVLHSPDRGGNWKLQRTGQPLPLNGLFFVDGQRGWAVGELGLILHTSDGGETWKVQRQGGQRLAALLVQARPENLPVEALAHLGAVEGYLAAGLCLCGPDPGSAAPTQAAAGSRLTYACRQVGGAAGEVLWQFPLPQHLTSASKQQLLEAWQKLHGPNVEREVLRQLVLALRIWRPNVVVTEALELAEGCQAGPLTAEALQAAVQQAGDPTAFPEQIQQLGLSAWKVNRVYIPVEGKSQAHLTLDGGEIQPRLRGSLHDFAKPAADLLHERSVKSPLQRYFRSLSGGSASLRSLLEGITGATEGVARRTLPPEKELPANLLQALRARQTLEATLDTTETALAEPGRVVGQLLPLLQSLPHDQGASAAFAVASQLARTGQWQLAQEAFLLMVDRYPAHPLSLEACRWLLRHNSSSEARRRFELNHFVCLQQTTFENRKSNLENRNSKLNQAVIEPGEVVHTTRLAYLSKQAETRQWYRGCLEIGKRLEGFGSLFADDPAMQLCLQAARRHLGEFQEAADWYAKNRGSGPQGAWREAIAAEHWLATRMGTPPRPVLLCRRVDTRPYLDGKFDDGCWENVPGVVLKNAVGATNKEYETEVRLAYDQEFLYLALRCQHPAEHHVPPAKSRPRDADLRPYDRVSLLLDLDRDYSTCFHLQIDQRGCVCEDCWGDRGWNPKWFVAVRSTPSAWYIEAAIPLHELTGQRVAVGTVWAGNVVRILPRRGVQAASVPADVEPRPEGMGLLLFQEAPARTLVQPVSRGQ